MRRRCAAAVARRSWVGYLVKGECRRVIKLPPVRPRAVEHHALTKRCRNCGELMKGRFPLGDEAAVQYGHGVGIGGIFGVICADGRRGCVR